MVLQDLFREVILESLQAMPGKDGSLPSLWKEVQINWREGTQALVHVSRAFIFEIVSQTAQPLEFKT